MKIGYAELVSTIALVIAFAGLCISGWVAFRDRPRLRITSQFIPASEYGPNRIVVTLLNKGRRPVILRLLGGTSQDGRWSGEFLDHKNGGLRLGEHERYEHTIVRENAGEFHHEDETLFFDNLWVEDSLGNRHPVPKSREHLRQLWP